MSAVVTATAHPSAPPPGPNNIRLTSTADGMDFSWDAVSDFDVYEYGVLYYDESIVGDFVQDAGFKGTKASITGLNPGDRFETAVETWATTEGELCAGLPAAG